MNRYDELRKALSVNLSVTDEQWATIAGFYKPLTARRNEILLEKGKISQYMYFIAKGCLRILLIDDDGQEATRFLMFEGQMGTAFPSFVLKQPSKASIQCVEPSEMLVIGYNDYQRLIDEMPGWETMTRLNLERAYIDAIERIESLITMDARERYDILLKQNPIIVQRLPNKIVADYLGISQETLSRLKSLKSGNRRGQ
ncbi:Crp/Fnr family transcriptional regulator [Mucilaginibacter sp. L3T2-6]|uniref:Crp/Fnr family transcriptional regulator n=1 Tax=Mucilaginibacter sp. L3T2-6 TaxID=3062491 RepID=UPI00267662B6|nr:Crp/Fnr family transcriptional regulator [Mucilaginibacter sp. L3T2-6]MDO3644262.1 Crp/Fnr family transcriptional regulator [Mucilaginibacter sp. L3T2-6]MDV6216641.1 Crp/Fnr family transcriptional regulator [Mucilaginibacter sp. L3T2-6]